jgi:hypothetical protein
MKTINTAHTVRAADPRGLTMAFQRRNLKAIDFKAPYPGSRWPFAAAVHIPTAAFSANAERASSVAPFRLAPDQKAPSAPLSDTFDLD